MQVGRLAVDVVRRGNLLRNAQKYAQGRIVLSAQRTPDGVEIADGWWRLAPDNESVSGPAPVVPRK